MKYLRKLSRKRFLESFVEYFLESFLKYCLESFLERFLGISGRKSKKCVFSTFSEKLTFL